MFHPKVKLRITRCPFCKEFLFNPKITLYSAKSEKTKAYFFKDLVGKTCQVIYGRFKGHHGVILRCHPRQKKFTLSLQSTEYKQDVAIDNLFLLE
jgi:transcription antitermination factor NusG